MARNIQSELFIIRFYRIYFEYKLIERMIESCFSIYSGTLSIWMTQYSSDEYSI